MEYSSVPILHFTGLILSKVAEDDGKGPCALVCSASRVKKEVKPLLISLHFGKDKRDIFASIAPGQIISGSFRYAGQAIVTLLSTDVEDVRVYSKCSNTSKTPPRFPSLGRKIVQQGLRLCHVNDFLPWKLINRYDSFPEFTKLVNDKLDSPGNSLVSMDFTGMVIRKIPKSERKDFLSGKEYLCVACNMEDSFELPLLTSLIVPYKPQLDNKIKFQATRGNIFSCTGIPVLEVYSEDGTNNLRCCQPSRIENTLLSARHKLLPYFYNTVQDMLWGRELFWPVFFPNGRIADNLGEVLYKIRSETRAIGISPQPKVHGWWGYGWFFNKTVKPKQSHIPGIKLYIPSFSGTPDMSLQELEQPRSKWPGVETVIDMIDYYFPLLPARIMAMPANEPRTNLKDKGCSISISQNPEIQEGSFKPDQPTWHLIQEWISKNYHSLLSYKWEDKEFQPV